jgi:hypothetical protein
MLSSCLVAVSVCLVLLGEVSSWSNAPNPAVETRGVGKVTRDNDAIAIDPATALQEYLDRAGATRFCDIGPTKYGRGLVARRDMQPGETVLRIPLTETIVVEKSRSSELLSPTSITSDAWAGQLAQKLVERERLATSSHENTAITDAYIDALPPPPPTPSRGDWSIEVLQTLDDDNLLLEIEVAKDWRNEQWEVFGVSEQGALGDQQRFLDALDLVSSRTIRCGSKFMLVPFLDMANYASRDQGGGYYELAKEGPNGDDDDDEDIIILKIGDRGVKAGDEICLDYGDRTNEEWLMYYGFLPDRNSAETLVLPESRRMITWHDANRGDESLREECRVVLDCSTTTLSHDIETLNRLEMDDENNEDVTMLLALKYRIARKTLLSAVAGAKTSSAFSSAFL